MRKALLLAVPALLLLACGAQAESDGDAAVREAAATVEPTQAPMPTPEPTVVRAQVYRLGEPAKTPLGNTVTARAVDWNASPVVYPPQPGMRYLAVEVEGCTRPDLDVPTALDPARFELQMEDNTRARSLLIGGKEPRLLPSVSMAGECTRGWVTFEFPAGARPKYVVYNTLDRERRPAVIKWAIE